MLINSLQTIQFENALRKHNYVGLIHSLLLSMAKAGALSGAEASARKKMQERIEQRKAAGHSNMDEEL